MSAYVLPRPPPRKPNTTSGSTAGLGLKAKRLGLNLESVMSKVGALTGRLKTHQQQEEEECDVVVFDPDTNEVQCRKPQTARQPSAARPPQQQHQAARRRLPSRSPRGSRSQRGAGEHDEEEGEGSHRHRSRAPGGPLRPAAVLKQYGHLLSDQDKADLLGIGDFQVYYLGVGGPAAGNSTKEKRVGASTSKPLATTGEEVKKGGASSPPLPPLRSHIAFRYELVGRMDMVDGWYGSLFLAYDYKKNEPVAMALQPLPHHQEQQQSHLNDSGSSRAVQFGTNRQQQSHHQQDDDYTLFLKTLPAPTEMIYPVKDRFVFRSFLCTTVEAQMSAVELLCAETEFGQSTAAAGVKSDAEVAEEKEKPHIRSRDERMRTQGTTPTNAQKKPRSTSSPNREKHASRIASNGGPALSLNRVLFDWGDMLPPQERKEIKQYEHRLYFLGIGSDKVAAPLPNTSETVKNFGWDDDQSMYRTVAGDHVAYRYELLNELGSGSFGQVMRAFDHKTGKHVALKIIKNLEKFHTQAAVEVRMLDRVRTHGGVEGGCIQMLHHFNFRSHVVISFEVCGMNLYELQKSLGYKGFTLEAMRLFSTCILRAMDVVWRQNIIHCDIKPENILLIDSQNPAAGLKLIDFGSGARTGEQIYTYIQSRFYRAPEIMLGLPYDQKIDMWSFGCVLCEMAIGFPIFPGETEEDQMSRILEIVPLTRTDAEFYYTAPRRSKFFHSDMRPRKYHPHPRKHGAYDLADVMLSQAGIDDPVFVDFIQEFLQWDPSYRAQPDEALLHPFLTGGGGDNKTTSPRQRRSSSSASSSSTEEDDDEEEYDEEGGSGGGRGGGYDDEFEDDEENDQ